jgi:regulator of sigma E protease
VAPIIGSVEPDSPAGRGGLEAGQEIIAVQGETVRSWDEINLKLVAAIGHSGDLSVEARDDGSTSRREYRLPVENWLVRQDPPQPLPSLGVAPWRPSIPAVLGRVEAGEAAAMAGLQPGDEVVAADGAPVDDWMHFVDIVRASPGEPLALEVMRDGERRDLTVTPGRNVLDEGATIGYIGAGVEPVEWPESYRRDIRHGPVAAVGEAVAKTGEMTVLTLGAIRKMLVGLISPSNLSGPITIAQISGDSARAGLESFVSFLAYLSISLAVLNLLPIPVLDGGHLLYYVVEIIRGRPVSERVQAVGVRIGLALVGSLMFMAIYFDLMRLW